MQDTQTNSDKIKDYSNEEKYNRKHAFGVSLLKWLECEFFGMFIFLSLFGLSPMLKNAGNVIFGIIGLVCYISVLADFGMKEGAKAHVKNTVRGDNVPRSLGLALGAVSMLPALLSYIVLLLSYFKVIGSSVLFFKLMNTGLWGIINLFSPDMKIANLSAALLGVYPVILLIFPLTVYISFRLSYDKVDIQTKILYKS